MKIIKNIFLFLILLFFSTNLYAQDCSSLYSSLGRPNKVSLLWLDDTSNKTGAYALINKIKGFPLNFEMPIMIDDEMLPLFKKSRASNVIYCAGFYCIKGPEGWRKSFCPKRSTLTSLEEWEGPFATELEMVSVLNIKKKENVG